MVLYQQNKDVTFLDFEHYTVVVINYIIYIFHLSKDVIW